MDYLAFLAETIERLHGAKATHLKTVPVHETFRGQTVWDGDVEVFELTGHPQAGRCFAWGYEADDGSGLQGVTVLAVPPVTDPRRAVQAYIASLLRGES